MWLLRLPLNAGSSCVTHSNLALDFMWSVNLPLMGTTSQASPVGWTGTIKVQYDSRLSGGALTFRERDIRSRSDGRIWASKTSREV